MKTRRISFSKLAFYYCIFVTVASLVAVIFRYPSDHYYIFSAATRDTWALNNPYGRAFLNSGYYYFWLYAPAATSLMLPFCYLPLKVGQFLYCLSSTIVFVSGLYQLIRRLELKLPELGIFFLLLSSEIVSSVPTVKIEPLSLGILCWTVSWFIDRRNFVAGGIFLGWAASWKFQLLPAAGLLTLTLLFTERKKGTIAFVTAFSLTLALMLLLPWLVFPLSYTTEMHRVWFESLSHLIRDTWFDYSSFYGMAHNYFGWPQSAAPIGPVNAVVAVFLAGLTALLARDFKESMPTNRYSPTSCRAHLLLTALALGVTYTTVFSPMSQGAGYVLAVPMLLLLVLWRGNFGWLGQRVLSLLLLLHWFFTHLIYSDVVPAIIRNSAGKVRPIGYSIIFFSVVISLLGLTVLSRLRQRSELTPSLQP